MNQAHKMQPANNYTPNFEHITNIYQLRLATIDIIRSSKLTVKAVAKKANVCSATVSRLLDGTTKDPRSNTILQILTSCDAYMSIHTSIRD